MMTCRSLCLLLAGLVSAPLWAQSVIENQFGMSFVLIHAGEFTMGTRDLDEALMEVPEAKADELKDETPAHTVILTKPFYIGQTEVTQGQWYEIMENKPGPEAVWNQHNWQNLPVASVSWVMAARFIEEINKLDYRYQYRLPTEAEWEFVARDDQDALRPVELDELKEHAWFINNSGDEVHPVATRKANRFGVYDMLGNVWEWVDDWYAPDIYSHSERYNPHGPERGRSKVRRGGSYHCPLHLVRPGYRSANPVGTRYDVVGFRVVLEKK